MFIKRQLILPPRHSLFLFGARGVGKSSLLETLFQFKKNLYINLLDPLEEARFANNPNELIELVEAMPKNTTHVIIDEVQKLPKLLDVVHLLIENKKTKKCFVLTGSSARKLKMAGVNLLAGRAFVYHLYPFSYLELGEAFNIEQGLHWGMLPKTITLKANKAKEKFLQSYAQTYLKEEVWAEQLIKKLDPFRRFLEVAAQCNGKIVNYANISKDVGVDDKSIKNYFSILEDTLLGFMLEPFQHSFRKRLKSAPKFYFIDVGIARALARNLTVPPVKSTSYYGELFEQFIVAECIKVAAYNKSEYRFSYLMTEAGVEIDLVVERPGKKILFIEIKSTNSVRHEDLTSIAKVVNDFGKCETVCFSCDPRQKKIGNIMVYPWQVGIKKFFSSDK
jgi:predicted AAA+ superfamily ATPase